MVEVGSNWEQVLFPTVWMQAALPGEAERTRGAADRAQTAAIRERKVMEGLMDRKPAEAGKSASKSACSYFTRDVNALQRGGAGIPGLW